MSISKRNQNRRNSIIVAILCISILLGTIIYALYSEGKLDSFRKLSEHTPKKGISYVHFLNVGQGDSELLIADDGTTMLIDGGEAEYGPDVIYYIRELGITKLDYIVATHPHSDHMGGLAVLISSDMDIGKIYMPQIASEYTPTTNTYEYFLRSVAERGMKITKAENTEFSFGSGKIKMYISDYAEDNYNNYSVVIKYEIGEKSFLFTGDIEELIERYYLDNDYDIKADVLKVPHHGSSTSSSADFLAAVDPKYCVIECGDNSYNHPNSNTVKKLLNYTREIYRTDVQGTVIFTTDGKTLEREFIE